ncbi:MAG: hypothetical protein L0323_05620 [Planctomycetes bacterium]|nr:hypothetical protein [Planctomycetota bacterium]
MRTGRFPAPSQPASGLDPGGRARRRSPAGRAARWLVLASLELGACRSEPRPSPPEPTRATDLRFSDLFETPVGPRGLRYTETVRRLAGERVRMLGYMVRQDLPSPGVFLFSPLPVQLHERETGHADDLPAATMHVFVPRDRDKVVPFTPGPLLLTGTLALGPREEPDGRTSNLRLFLDPPSAGAPDPGAGPSQPPGDTR